MSLHQRVYAVQFGWDVDQYFQACRSTYKRGVVKKSRIQALFPPFPPKFDVVIDFPAVFIDRHFRIICWYLPEVLSEMLQVREYNIPVVQ